MCGIVGYASQTPSSRALDVVLEGLGHLEYRGYDSAGVALVGAGELFVAKEQGKLAALAGLLNELNPPASRVAIGHTRWATHGAPSATNAHPHVGGDGEVALVHNGIIENHAPLREELEAAGFVFASQTDSEVAAHLLALEFRRLGDLPAALGAVAARLEGAFTLLAVHRDVPDAVAGVRFNSPLVVGLGQGESYLASDVAAFAAHTTSALELGQHQVVTLRGSGVELTDLAGEAVTPRGYTIDWDPARAAKGGWATFMDKEIHEQPQVVADTLAGRRDAHGNLQLDDVAIPTARLREIDKLIVVACGSAANAGHVAKYAIEHWCRIPVEVELASEFRYRDPVVSSRTLVVAISQSGETMDTLMAVRHAREQGAAVIALVNTMGSTIARESDAVLYTHAGPETAVAATKTFLAQVTAAYLLGLYLAQLRSNLYSDEVAERLANLAQVPDAIATVLSRAADVRALARELSAATSVLFLGRHVGYPVALEGALKLKELAYIHAEGFAAGELKHGPIALIEPGLPVFVVVPTRRRDLLHAKVLSNLAEIRARGARTLVIAEEGDDAVAPLADDVIWVPPTPTLLAPLVTTVPLQLFACELAGAKGHDVDQPRNLAKSVTVE